MDPAALAVGAIFGGVCTFVATEVSAWLRRREDSLATKRAVEADARRHIEARVSRIYRALQGMQHYAAMHDADPREYQAYAPGWQGQQSIMVAEAIALAEDLTLVTDSVRDDWAWLPYEGLATVPRLCHNLIETPIAPHFRAVLSAIDERLPGLRDSRLVPPEIHRTLQAAHEHGAFPRLAAPPDPTGSDGE